MTTATSASNGWIGGTGKRCWKSGKIRGTRMNIEIGQKVLDLEEEGTWGIVWSVSPHIRLGCRFAVRWCDGSVTHGSTPPLDIENGYCAIED